MTLDDAVWWIEWVVTASIALALLLVVASHRHELLLTKQVGLGIAVTFLGYSVMPYFARLLCYDETGKLKSWRHVLGLNMIGMGVLVASVLVGARPNG